MAEQPVPRFFLALMIGAAVLLAYVAAPIATDLLLAAVIAGALWPVQVRFAKRLRGHGGVTAGILTLGVVVLLLGPLATLATFIISEGSNGVHFIAEAARSKQVAALVERLPLGAQDVVQRGLDRMPTSMDELMSSFEGHTSEAVSTVSKAVTKTGSIVLHVVLTVIALFFLLVRGKELVHWFEKASPLGRRQTQELIATFRKVAYSVVVATLATAAVQTVTALVGFFIARVPAPYFFALLVFFCAFVPAIGATGGSLFAAALLLVSGHPYHALFLAAWSIGMVSVVDNLAKPLFMRKGLETHGAILFFAIIGGLTAFGLIGIVLGPLAIALMLTLVRIYQRDYSPAQDNVPTAPGLPPDPSGLA